MIFNTRKISVAIFIFAMTFIAVNCGLAGELGATLVAPQPISGAVEIKDEWTEFSPKKPLKSLVRIHKLSIQTDDIKGYDTSDKNGQTLEFKNGKSGKVEAILYDDKGNEYNLGIVGVGGKDGGFYLGKVHSPSNRDSKEPDFPFGRVYKKLKIRSDLAFQAKKIEWLAEVQK